MGPWVDRPVLGRAALGDTIQGDTIQADGQMHLDSPPKYTPLPEAELGSEKGTGGGEPKREVSWRPGALPCLIPTPLLAS